MRYAISHTTVYSYTEPVGVSHNLLHLLPRDTDRQVLESHHLLVEPEPAVSELRRDYFGNQVSVLTIQDKHTRLSITATSTVAISPVQHLDASASWPWEQVRELIARDRGAEALAAAEFAFDSPLVPTAADYAAYAAPAFAPGRPLLDAALDLNQRINLEFQYDPRATSVGTPVAEVMAKRRGVCQDFAQVMIACLRSLGLAARYVSGYLETLPPEGQKKLVGADASHAWVSVWCPPLGWVDLDPTNSCLVGERHITVAHGRDFSDVTPIRGVILGGGHHAVAVAVDVNRIADDALEPI